MQNHLSALAKVTREVKASHDLLQRHRRGIFIGDEAAVSAFAATTLATQKSSWTRRSSQSRTRDPSGTGEESEGSGYQFDRLAKKNQIGEIDAAKLSAQLQKQIRQTRTEMTSLTVP